MIKDVRKRRGKEVNEKEMKYEGEWRGVERMNVRGGEAMLRREEERRKR